MLDWLADYLSLIMFLSMFFFIFMGYPVAFIMGGLALIFALAGAYLGVFNLIGISDVVLRMWAGVAADPVLASIPMFIFMGAILERSGSAKDMLDATELLMKWCPGALAVSVMVMGTILAAPIGVVGAAVITLSVIALPQMIRAGYDKQLAIGTIASAGTLGILIPPAIMLVVMAEMLATSAGNLFLGAIMPGFLLSGLYTVYIIAVAILKPGMAPKLPPDFGPQTRAAFWHALWRGLFPMTALLVIVLGSIFAGWATPTESGAVGVLGSMLIAALNGRMTMRMMTESIFASCRANGLVFMIFLGATGFSYVFRVLGGDDVMISTLTVLRHHDQVGDADLHHGADLPARLSLRVDRDLPDRAADLRSDPAEVRFLRPPGRQQHRADDLVRHAGRGEPADGIHDAAVRRHAVLHEGDRAARHHHARRLPGDVSVRRPPGGRPVPVHLVPGDRPLAAAACRVHRLSSGVPGTEGNDRPPAAFVARSLSSAPRSKMFAYVAILGSLVTLSLISFIAGAVAG